MYRIGICEKNILLCSELENLILESCKDLGLEVSIDIWYNGMNLLNYLEKGNELEFLFLRVGLPDIDGIRVGNEIRKRKNYQMKIAYISTNLNHVIDVFQNHPVAFLLLPLQQEDIRNLLDREYRQFIDMKVTFTFKKQHTVNSINFDKILYFGSCRKKVQITLDNGKLVEFYGKLEEIKKQLPSYFIVIHKSYIINKYYVKKYQYDEVEMKNGDNLPISRVHRNEVKIQMS